MKQRFDNLCSRFNNLSKTKKILIVAIGTPIAIFLAYVLCVLFWVSYHLSNDEILYKGKYYKQENLPREATEEWGELKARLREVQTVQSPEETYKLFRDFMKEGKYEFAIMQITPDQQEKYMKLFNDPTKKAEVEKFIEQLPGELKKTEESEFLITYEYTDGEKTRTIRIQKQITGYWLIKSL